MSMCRYLGGRPQGGRTQDGGDRWSPWDCYETLSRNGGLCGESTRLCLAIQNDFGGDGLTLWVVGVVRYFCGKNQNMFCYGEEFFLQGFVGHAE